LVDELFTTPDMEIFVEAAIDAYGTVADDLGFRRG
jgi:hypothetical protein